MARTSKRNSPKPRDLELHRSVVVPRLLRRRDAAAYLNLSPAQFDLLRTRGEFRTVRVPSERNPGGVVRVPLFDIRDLDASIERWKTEVTDAP